MGEGAGQVTDVDRLSRSAGIVGDDAAPADTGDREVDALVGDIVETRDEMTVTVEEIGDRLDPQNIIEGAKETVREATVGKVETMANTAGMMVTDAGDTVREAGSGLVDRITSNPIPAAMVGLGLGWLALSSRPATQGQSRSTDGAQQRAAMMADQVGRTVDDVTGKAGRTVDNVTGKAGRIADELPYQVRSTADQIGSEAGRMFQSNPLAVGAIAVAVGTAVGLAMPATEMERRAIARPARQVMERAEDAATDAMEGVEESVREAEQTARQKDIKAKAH
jgi:hypothetical protein